MKSSRFLHPGFALYLFSCISSLSQTTLPQPPDAPKRSLTDEYDASTSSTTNKKAAPCEAAAGDTALLEHELRLQLHQPRRRVRA